MKDSMKKESKLITSAEEFKTLLKSSEFLFVLFSNENCGYCKIAENNIKEVIDSFPDLDLYLLKLSDAPDIFREYNVNSAPVIKLFKDGEAVYTGFGVRKADDIYYQLKSYFGSGNSYFKELAENN
ncbi:MAG: thioredoxin family protein [Halanaerobium sp.]